MNKVEVIFTCDQHSYIQANLFILAEHIARLGYEFGLRDKADYTEVQNNLRLLFDTVRSYEMRISPMDFPWEAIPFYVPQKDESGPSAPARLDNASLGDPS